MNVLVACEESQRVCIAFRNRGHEAYSCDMIPCSGGHPEWHIQGDATKILGDGWDLMIAHPPCTYLTVTGNKWFLPEYHYRFPNREQQREDAIKLFMAFANADIPKIAIENPIGIMSNRYRRLDEIIQPFNYGAPVRKSTCLWLKNLPPLMSLHRYPDEVVTFKSGKTMSRLHYDSASLAPQERARKRSETFQGIANAMAEQWG